MTVSQTDKLIAAEGGLASNPFDKGGLTKFGITKPTLSWYLGRAATDDDIRNLTIEDARAIYEKRYILGPGFDKLPPGVLQSNVIDFGVMSGPQLALMNLQDVLGITQDGVMGPQTLQAIAQADPVALNKQLTVRRCLMAARVCKKDPTQLAFLVGWLQRFLSFI